MDPWLHCGCQMPSPLVSVCLPVYNGSRYLAQSIESVLAQTHTNFELLLADDCSTDESAKICLQYAQRDQRVKFWRNASNLGLFANYNRCMENAQGAYIKPFAQDDILHPEMLAKTVEIFQSNSDISLISVGRRWIDENGANISRHVSSPRADNFVPANRPLPGSVVIRKALTPVTNFIGEPLAVIFRADAKGTGFDEDLAHVGDLEYWLRLLHNGSFYYKSDILCSYRSHPGCQTRKNWADYMISSDFLKLGKKCAWALDEVGICKEQFEAQIVRSAAYGAACYWDGKRLDAVPIEHLSTAAIDATPRERVLLQIISSLHKLQSEAPVMVALDLPADNRSSKYANSVRFLEKELACMLSSKSWTYTKPLRDLNRLLGFSASTVASYELGLKSKGDQTAYVNYLKKIIDAIRSSRSWRISAPIRAFADRPLGDKVN